MNSKERIVKLIRAEYERASEAYRKAHAERVGMDAAANAWDQFNPDDGVSGFSQNPHNSNRLSQKEETSKVYAHQMREAYEFAVDTFLSDLPLNKETHDE